MQDKLNVAVLWWDSVFVKFGLKTEKGKAFLAITHLATAAITKSPASMTSQFAVGEATTLPM